MPANCCWGVARFSAICAPWMITCFFCGACVALPMLTGATGFGRVDSPAALGAWGVSSAFIVAALVGGWMHPFFLFLPSFLPAAVLVVLAGLAVAVAAGGLSADAFRTVALVLTGVYFAVHAVVAKIK